MTNLLDLPDKVFSSRNEGSILRHLFWNDLLRCRRVCKQMKLIVEDFIRVHPEIAPAIDIFESDTEKNLTTFLETGIPTTKLVIKNSTGHEFFDKLDVITLNIFAEYRGPMIQSVRLEQLSVWPCFNEWTFLSSLTSLKTLEADFIGYGDVRTYNDVLKGHRHDLSAQRDDRVGGLYLPESFKNTLKVIKIGSMQPSSCIIRNIQNRARTILSEYKNLDYISFPINLQYQNGPRLPRHLVLHQPRDILVLMMTEFLTSISTSSQAGKEHVKFIDFENYHVNWTFQVEYVNKQVSPNFLALCKQCSVSGVKLLNVEPAWLSERQYQRDPVLRSNDVGITIMSLINLEPSVSELKMPNLEKIDIRQTSHSAYDIYDGEGRPQWPSLKTLIINVDLKSEFLPEQQELQSLFDFFFKDIVRHQLTELVLSFESELRELAPKTEDIVSSCPNLKILKISNWPGTNKALTKLWSGLPALEQVTFEKCSGLGNVAFVGVDVGRPLFLKLKNLRKLTLKGLDQMPKISDTLLSLVLAKMKLTHFTLTSKKPLLKVTRAGINALLKDSDFAKNIEKFPFVGWSLANVSDEEFTKMGMQFRSSQMM